MKKIKKADVIIVSVLLLMIIGIVLMVSRGGGNGSSGAKEGGDSASAGAASSQSGELSYTDYNGKKIGILTGTNMEAESFKYFPDSEYLYYDGYPNMNMALLNGSIDAYLGDEPALKSIHAEQPDIDYIKKRLTDNQYSFAFRKDEEGETKLRDQLNAFLAKCQTDGTLAEIDSIWFGIDDSKKVVDLSGLTGENGTVHVVTTSTDEPFSYIKNGKHVGYDIDVTARFCKEYGYALEIGDVDFQARIPALASGKYEFTTSMNVTPEREEEVMFSDPVSSGGIVVAVRSEDLAAAAPAQSDEPSYTEYNGRKIGIITGKSFEAPTFDYFPDSEYLYFNSYNDISIALAKRSIDGFIGDEPALRMLVNENQSVGYLRKMLVNDTYAFGFAKNNDKTRRIREQFNEMLAEFKADGTLNELNDVWFGTDESKKTIDMSGLTGERLNVVTTSSDVPFSYIKDGKLSGFSVDLVARFCRKYGYEPHFDDVDFSACIPGLVSNKYDMCASSLAVTEDRKESIDFSDAVYEGGLMLAVRASDLQGLSSGSSGAVSIAELNSPDKKIGAGTGSTGMSAVEEYLPDAQHISFSNQFAGYLAVKQGKIDAYVYDHEQMQIAIENGFDGVRLLDENLGPDTEVAAGISYTSPIPDLKKKLDDFITEMEANGTLDAMHKRWAEDRNYEMPDLPGTENPEFTLRVGTTGTVEPYSFYKDNELTGYDIELVKRFAYSINAAVEFKVTDFDGVVSAAESSSIDCIFSNLYVIEEARDKIDYSIPIMIIQNGIMVADSAAAVKTEDGFLQKLKQSFEKNFIREDRYKLILEGIATTCIITVLSVLFGSLLAFLICLFRRTDSILAEKIANLYVKLLQGTPMVVLLMILYYVIFGKSGIAAMWVAVIGFSLNFGAYVSEILRSGIESIDGGQREAALALGYTENQAFFRFIFPQAALRQIPVYRGEIISLLKNTSIVGYIAIQDLTKMSDIIRSRTYEAFFPLIATAMIYFILAFIISVILNLILKAIDPRAKKRNKKGGAEA